MSKENLVMRIIMQANDKASAAFKNIQMAGNGLSGSLLKTKNELKDLNKTMSKAESFANYRNQLQSATKAVQENERAIANLSREIKLGGQPTRAQIAQMSQLENKAQALAKKETDLKDKVAMLGRELKKTGFDTNNFAQAQVNANRKAGELSSKLDKQRQALEKLSSAEKKYQRAKDLQGKLASTGVKTGAMSVATGAAVMAPIKEYAKAETANIDLRVAMMDKSGKVSSEYKEMEKLATRLGDKLPGTTADFTNLMTMLRRQGLSSTTILNGTGEAAALLAVQLKLVPEAAAEMTAKLQDATNGTEKEMLGIMDVTQRLFYAGVDHNNIVPAFSRLAPALGIIKMKGKEAMDSMGPLIGMLDQAALTGEAAGNALRKVFTRAMDNDKIEKALKDYKDDGSLSKSFNLKFTDNKGEFAGLDNMYKQLSKLKGLSTEMRLSILKDIWGDDAETNQALDVMISKGKEGYDEFAKKMADQASLQQRVDMQLGTLANLWDAASGTATNFLVKMGESIAPEVKMLTTFIGSIAEKMSAWAAANPKTAATLMKIAAVTAVVLGVVSLLALGIAAVIGPIALMQLSWAKLAVSIATGTGPMGRLFAILKYGTGILSTMFSILKAGIIAVGRALLMNPIGLIITGIVALVVAGYYLWKHWDKVKSFFVSMWQKVDTAFQNNPILNLIFPMIGVARLLINHWQAVRDFFVSAWQTIASVFANYPILNYIFPLVGIARLLIDNWQAVVSFFASAWQSIQSFFSSGIGNISATILNWSPVGLFYRAFAAVLSFLGVEIPAKMTNLGAMIVQGLINGLASKFPALSGLWSSISGMFGTKMEKKNDIRSPSRVMARLGNYIMQGLEVGVLRGKAALANTYDKAIGVFQNPITTGGFLDRAVKTFMPEGNPMHPKLAGAIDAPIAGFGMAGKQQSMSMAGDNITIQIFAGNNDVGSIRKEIEQVLRERDMKKQRTRNSSFWDKD